MRARTLLLAAGLTVAASALPAQTGATALPDMPHDTLREALPSGAAAIVLRYILPDLPGMGYEGAAPKMDALCVRDGLPAWQAMPEPRPQEIVIVLMDRAIPRGRPSPEATQFISAYRPNAAEDACLWL